MNSGKEWTRLLNLQIIVLDLTIIANSLSHLVVMFREMLLFGLDRDNQEHYPLYFEIKQKLQLHAQTMDRLVQLELEIMGIVAPGGGCRATPDQMQLYYYIKSRMAEHGDKNEIVLYSEMPMLALDARLSVDRCTYYGIKRDLTMKEEEEEDEEIDEGSIEAHMKQLGL